MDKAHIVERNLALSWKSVYSVKEGYQFLEKNNSVLTLSDANDPLLNGVLKSQLAKEEIISGVEEYSKFYLKKRLSFCWWVNKNTDNPALIEELERQRFTLFGPVAGMVIDLSNEFYCGEMPKESQIKVVSCEEDLKKWLLPIQIGFSMSDESAKKYYELFASLSHRFLHFIYLIKNKVVASASLFLGPDAGIYNCATLPEYQGRGALTSLTQRILQEAKSKDYRYATLQASPMSVSTFTKIGFESVVPYQLYLKII